MRYCLIAVMSFFVLSVVPVHAQSVPADAMSGTVSQDLIQDDPFFETGFQSNRALLDSLIRGYSDEGKLKLGDPLPDASSGEPAFFVERFQFEGNAVFSDEQLTAWTEVYRKRQITLEQMQAIADMIAHQYHREGFFLAKVYLPEQNIENQQVTFRILEGKLAQVEVEGTSRYPDKFITRRFHPAEKEILNADRLLASLLVLNEYPGLRVQSYIAPGENEGEAAVILKVREDHEHRLIWDYNNFGSRYVNRSRTGLSYYTHSVIRPADELTIRGVSGVPEPNLGFMQMAYGLPVNGYGGMLSFSGVISDFDVQREFRALESAGDLYAMEAEWRQPILRQRRWFLDFYQSYEYKNVKNYLLGDISSEDSLHLVTMGLSGKYHDAKAVPHSYHVSLLGGRNRSHINPSRSGSAGNFLKLNLSLDRLQRIVGDVYLYLSGDAQISNDEMPSSEQLALGGGQSVRGYPQSELIGDSGYQTTIEVRLPVPFTKNRTVPFLNRSWRDTFQLAGFFDYGTVNLANPLSGETKEEEIMGFGMGLRMDFGHDVQARLDFGFPLGGNDPSDGSNGVGYLSLQKAFSF